MRYTVPASTINEIKAAVSALYPVEETDAEQRKYRIGAMCCRMTASQAQAWNGGDVTPESMRGALVFIPSREGARSYVKDGEVIVHDGLPTGEHVDLWTAIDVNGDSTELYDQFMDGESAVEE